MKNMVHDIKMVPVKDIKPFPKNPKPHTEEQVVSLMEIIKANGFRDPLTISNQSGFLVCGHGRLMAAKRLGMEELPVTFQDFESEALEYAHLVADNAVTAQTALDFSMIHMSIIDLGPFDLKLMGIPDFRFEPPEQKIEELVKPVKEIVCPKCGERLSQGSSS